jgi:signal transduction histidine kinase
MRLRLPLERHAVNALAVALAVVGVVQALAGVGDAPKAEGVGVALIAALPLLLHRRFPLVAPVFVLVALAALSVGRLEAVKEGGSTAFCALLLAFWIVGAHPRRRQAVAGVAIGFAALAVLARSAGTNLDDDPLLPGSAAQIGTFTFDIIFVFSLAAGLSFLAYALQSRERRASALEQRAARLEREREAQADAAVAAERRRIARDLHGVIAHSVSVMIVQAGAARFVLEEQPGRALAPLRAVEETGRQALAETRRLLGILRSDEGAAALAPQPGLAAVDELVAHAWAAGLPVELTVEGEARPLQPGLDLAAYRIVQEALTNVRDHAGPARAHVTVSYGRDALELEITDDGRALRDGESGGGRLVRTSERVALYGGELEAGPRPRGGFTVRVRLPLELAHPAFPSAVHAKRPLHERAQPQESDAARDGGGLRARLQLDVFDALVVGLAVVSEIEIWVTSVPGPKLVLVPGVLLWTLPLLWRRRFPFAAPTFAFAMQALSAFAGDEVASGVTGYAAFLLTFWAVGAHNGRHQALAGVAIGFASIAVITDRDVRVDPYDMASVIVTGGALSFFAYALQRRARRAGALEERADRLEREREARARAAVAEERRRIARELHDLVAHSVSVMTVQAGAARLVLEEEPRRALAPLRAVEETGRQALAEMSRLLGILRGEEDQPALVPQSSLADLDALLAQARASGLPVELTVEGEPAALPPGVDMAAYRIVQEALTNARRHAGPAHAHVTISYGRDALELEVADDGRGGPSGQGSGHGLVGMRERAGLYDGELEAGPRPGGGYSVRARLPLEALRS